MVLQRSFLQLTFGGYCSLGWLIRQIKSLNRIVLIAFSVYHVTMDYSRQVPSVSSVNGFNPIINSYPHNAQCQHELLCLFNPPAVLEVCCTRSEAVIPFVCHVVYDPMCLKVIGQAACAPPELCKKLLWFTRCLAL